MATEAKPQIQPSPALQPETPAQRENGRWSGYWGLFVARWKELLREPEVIFWVFVFPLVMALGLGIAFRNKPVDMSRIAVVESPQAQRAMQLIQASPNAKTIHSEVLPAANALNKFRLGKYDMVVMPGPNGGFEYRYDPARPESVLARETVNSALQSAAGRTDPLPAKSSVSSEPGSRYIDFLVPGLLGMNLMNAALWGIGFGLVDMRQRKLLKRYLGTPMRRSDFLLVLATNRLVLMMVEMALLLGFGIIAFRMRVVGSWLSIILVTGIGALCFGGLGLLVASRAQKIESASGLINLVMMPMWIFSGVFFSYERFPAAVQPLFKALPLTALNDSLRAIILEGSSLASQSGRILVMVLWGGISFILAVKWFRWI